MTHTDIIKLFQENKDIFPHIRTDYLKRCVDSGRTISYYHGNTLVGVLIWFQYRKSIMKLEQILVDSKFRGLGISKLLFLHFEVLAKARVTSKIILWVRASNTQAIGFYRKMGMTNTDTCTWNEQGTRIDGIKFEKLSEKQTSFEV